MSVQRVLSNATVQSLDLPHPHGDCEPSHDYVQAKCLIECQERHVVATCNCKFSYMPGASRTFALYRPTFVWVALGSRVVSVLDSGAEGSGFKSQSRLATLSGNSLRPTVHTHCASVHQAAKLVAALLRVARVTAGLVESNGSLSPGL